jgi:tubulin epsilon
MRFPGQLNTDLNEITTNLVPYPSLHFLVPSLAPDDGTPSLSASSSGNGAEGGSSRGRAPPRAAVVRQLFSDAFSPHAQLLASCDDPRRATYLASALLLRGQDLSVSDVNACMAKLQPSLRMVHWNQEGFKVGLCSAEALEHPHSVLGLANNTCIAGTFEAMHARFAKLYGRRAMVHHYAQYMGDGDAGGGFGDKATHGLFGQAEEALLNLTEGYRALETASPPSDAELTRFVPAF